LSIDSGNAVRMAPRSPVSRRISGTLASRFLYHLHRQFQLRVFVEPAHQFALFRCRVNRRPRSPPACSRRPGGVLGGHMGPRILLSRAASGILPTIAMRTRDATRSSMSGVSFAFYGRLLRSDEPRPFSCCAPLPHPGGREDFSLCNIQTGRFRRRSVVGATVGCAPRPRGENNDRRSATSFWRDSASSRALLLTTG